MNRMFSKRETCHKRGFDVCKTPIKIEFSFALLTNTHCQKTTFCARCCYRWISLCCIGCYRLAFLQARSRKMGLVKSLYILAPQQQPHHLIFAKMKHIFQAHLFLLPIINSVRFDIVEQQCACNKGIFNVADNENQSLLFCQFPMGLQKAKFAFFSVVWVMVLLKL